MPIHGEAVATASALMAEFAERTGLSSERPPQRYLWTDAFAVRNLLELAHRTGDERQRELALRLIDQVHRVLGRFRPDDRRSGWLSGLAEQDGAAHPTRGGLRIGKPLPERGAAEVFDAQREWERDGQYFHYLTQWMLALDQAAAATREARFSRWARELAEVAHAAFTAPFRQRGRRQMAWKMSTDLSRPAVASMGQHDALDGLVTYLTLDATASRLGFAGDGPPLGHAIAELEAMAGEVDPRTADPLGLGGLLVDAFRLAQMQSSGFAAGTVRLDALLAAAEAGIHEYRAGGDWRAPAFRRLGFRELGLAIGISAVARAPGAAPPPARLLEDLLPDGRARACARRLAAHGAFGAALTEFWLAPTHRQVEAWTAHRDINDVMLATSLIPEACLSPRPA